MAGDAIVHFKRFKRLRGWTIESFHGAMTGLTVELRYRDVDPMREKYMRRQPPHPLPGNFLTLLAKGFELTNLRTFGIPACMTG